MNRSVKAFITLLVCTIMLTSIIPFATAADTIESVNNFDSVEYNTISIGAGGSFYLPVINPTDSAKYIVTSDMGGIYYTDTSGELWERTNICCMNASCITEDGRPGTTAGPLRSDTLTAEKQTPLPAVRQLEKLAWRLA